MGVMDDIHTSSRNAVDIKSKTDEFRIIQERVTDMIVQPCHAPGEMSEAAYAQHVTGKGPKFRDRQRMWM